MWLAGLWTLLYILLLRTLLGRLLSYRHVRGCCDGSWGLFGDGPAMRVAFLVSLLYGVVSSEKGYPL
jgi:hypothetical protein